MIWLLIFASVVGFLFACLLLEQLLFERRAQPSAGKPVIDVPPPAHPSWGHADHRHTRPPAAGRHRKEGPCD